MHAAWYRARVVAVVTLCVTACRERVEPFEPDDDLTPDSTNALFITLTKGTWQWDEVAAPQGSGVRATLTNGSERSLVSTLGDKFNSATEHADLFIAKGGSAALEWRDPDGGWRPAALATLVEGVKPVLLRRGGHYTLTALLFGPRQPGLYRIRIDFFDAPSGAVRQSDYSGPFEIR